MGVGVVVFGLEKEFYTLIRNSGYEMTGWTCRKTGRVLGTAGTIFMGKRKMDAV